jgi:ankyrin repeat protein
VVEWLVANGADANYPDAIGYRPLHLAVAVLASDCPELLKLQVLQITQFLLDYGADPNIRDVDGNTPLKNLLGVCCDVYGKVKFLRK